MPRQRKPGNKSLPPNLYTTERGGKIYYRYRHPETNQETGLGTDRRAAIEAANIVNTRLATEIAIDFVDRIEGRSMPSFSEWIDGFKAYYFEQDIKPGTIKTNRSVINRLGDEFGDRIAPRITRSDFAKFLGQQTASTANAMRAMLIQIYEWAIEAGQAEINICKDIKTRKFVVKRTRLTEEQYWTIYDQAQPYLQRAMALAMITGQRRVDIVSMRFADIKKGVLHWTSSKTGQPGSMPVEGWLADIISDCRSTGAVSKYLVHHSRRSGVALAGRPIHKDTISGAFAKCRDKTGLFDNLKYEQRPTFHEIRSLAARLHKQLGGDPQEFLGHLQQSTTDRYLNSRGSETPIIRPLYKGNKR